MTEKKYKIKNMTPQISYSYTHPKQNKTQAVRHHTHSKQTTTDDKSLYTLKTKPTGVNYHAKSKQSTIESMF